MTKSTSSERRLNAAAAEVLSAGTDAERIAFIKRSKWIPYDAANKILQELEDLLVHPVCSRMPNLLLVGNTNNGKTEILNYFLRKHPFINREDAETLQAPVIYIQAPPDPREERLYKAVLNAINVPYPMKATAGSLLNQILTILPQIGCRMLVIDEIHDLLGGSSNQHRLILKAIKHLSNALKIPIVGAGVDVAFNVFQTEDQLANRFTHRTLPLWSRAKNEVGPFERMLASLESVLPLRKRSGLAGEVIASNIYLLGEGLLGEMVRLISDAAVEAIRSKREVITVDLLKELPFVPPSMRRSALAFSGGEFPPVKGK